MYYLVQIENIGGFGMEAASPKKAVEKVLKKHGYTGNIVKTKGLQTGYNSRVAVDVSDQKSNKNYYSIGNMQKITSNNIVKLTILLDGDENVYYINLKNMICSTFEFYINAIMAISDANFSSDRNKLKRVKEELDTYDSERVEKFYNQFKCASPDLLSAVEEILTYLKKNGKIEVSYSYNGKLLDEIYIERG